MTREVLSNGVIVPEKYTRDWFDDFRTNLVKLNDAITAIAGKQNALTQEQLDAVNSAITSQKVTAYDDHIADTSKHLTDGTAPKAIADEDGNTISSTYGKLAGSQTWSGINTYNDGIYTKTGFRAINDSYSSGTPSANIFYSALAYGGFVSNTFTRSFSIDGAIRTTGYNDLSLRVYSQTGEVLSGVLIESNATASDIAFRPLINGTHKLGTSSYRWSSVYADSYYYGTTAWGLDKENTWSNTNIYTGIIAYKDTIAEIGNYPASNRIHYQSFVDKNGTTLGYTNFAVATNGVTSWNLWLENKATNGQLSPTGTQVKSFMGLYIDTDMSSKLKLYGDFIPNNTNRFDLGTSTNKWKTLNGVNPGALSLPKVDGWNSGIALDTTNWDMSGGTWNEMTNDLLDGWVYFAFQGCGAGDRITVRYYGTDARYLTQGFAALANGYMYAVFPLSKGFKANIAFSTSGTAMSKYIYPCLGNV